MGVLFGVVGEAQVLTPEGPRAMGELQAGDRVLAWDSVHGKTCERRVVRMEQGTVDNLYVLVTETTRLRGCTPGLQVWDAFESMFRAAGSLSALAELGVLTDGGLRAEPLLDAEEQAQPGAAVWWLHTDGEEGTLFVDGVLVRHRVGR